MTPAPTPASSQTSSPPDDKTVADAFGGDDDSDLPVDDDLMALAGAADDDDAAAKPPEPTPAATPTPAPSATPSAAPAAVTPDATPAAAPAATPAPAASGPAPVVTATPTPAQPAAAAPAAAQPAQPEPTAGAPQTLEQVREKHISDLAEKVFVLDQKELDEWDLDKGKMAKGLSRLAAQVTMVTMENVIHSVAQQFPGWLQNYTRTQTTQDEIKNEFVSAFPGLKDHLDKVEPIAIAYRAANPKATRQDAIRAVGEIVHSTYSIPKPMAAAPSAPARTTLPPVQLHGNATPRVAPASVVSQNPFEALAAQDAQYDDD